MQSRTNTKSVPQTSRRLEAYPVHFEKTNRENQKQFNDRLLNYRKKLYCVKQKIPLDNVYDRAFKILNKSILTKLNETNEQHMSNNLDRGEMSFENYPKIYKKSSNILLKMMKATKPTPQKENKEQNIDLLKSIRKMDFTKIIGHDKVLRRNASESKLFDFDERIKNRMIIDRNMTQLTKQTNKIVGRFQPDIIHELNHSVRVVNNEHRELPHIISKNCYLVSLNYNFQNPLI